jgi:cation-transporting ATPase 13A3/4/5
LHEANIETVMVTGDNILTAINVGRDCKLVKPEQTVVKVEADLVVESYSSHLNVSYTIEDESPTNVDVI